MPIYEYVCAACGHRLEARQRLDDEPLKKCPKCGKSTLKKVISAPHIQFKGSGFYETDYKSSCKKQKSDKSNTSKKSGDACSSSGCCSCCQKSKKEDKE
ncbi:MAG: zinc ribbon domain-containing protein [Pseudomonadota bacterium]|nr:zinc ribbon domain-containing protein [Gammaproteobacteria bacterium]MBU1558911.1 zinc ribbon domain-containing protein [Gammaproteobacteria bacterium]MBU2546247.1 zinc ribbon domain-containing protein [Gammaproteobacteria bacterium]